MAIKTKNAGAYADVVGVFHKRAGTYEAVQGVFVKSAGVYGRVDAPPPSTVNYTGTQVQSGFVGSLSTTSIAGRITGQAYRTAWVGVITGTEAKLTSYNGSGTSAQDGQIEVSVDGGAYTAVSRVGAVFTLFTGLSHSPHKVVWRFGNAFGSGANIPAATTALIVTGQPPSILLPSEVVQPDSFGSLSISDAATAANEVNFSPVRVRSADSTYGSNVPSVVLRGSFTKLYVGKNSKYVYVSKNGASPTRYGPITEANTPATGLVLDLDGSLSTYSVWSGNPEAVSSAGTFGAGGDTSLQDIGTKRRLTQYGDSITFAATATSCGECETFRVAAAMGFVGGTSGVSGDTIASLDSRLSTVLASRTVTSSDVAIIAIGRNDGTPAWDSTKQTGYTSIINKLVAKGYGKVLCRGILNDSANFSAANSSMQSVVTSVANANVIYVSTASWTGVATSDGVHPTDAGFVTLASFAEPAYRSALGL